MTTYPATDCTGDIIRHIISLMLIPYRELQKSTLVALIEEFIDREGTDYGEFEVSREAMINQVYQQLSDGKVVICYDEESETCNLITANKAKFDPDIN